MKKFLVVWMLVAFLCGAAGLLMAQSGSSIPQSTLGPDIAQSISRFTPKVFLVNSTNGKVIFYLESSGTSRTEHFLEAGESASFSGASSDRWFNIEVYSSGTKVEYGLDAGKRYLFKWRNNVLDVLHMPPN